MFNFRKFILIFLAFVTCPTNSYKMIVLTGGPCAGKSSSLPILEGLFAERTNYQILILDEIATSLINKGITPNTLSEGAKEFQQKIFDNQIEREDELIKKAERLENEHPGAKCIIICDRGLLDGLAYMDEKERKDILKSHNLTIENIYHRYDLVIHLQSFANDAELYRERKGDRWEKQKQAVDLDKKLYNLWKNHKNFNKIGNINEKQERRAGFIFYNIFNFLNPEMSRQLFH